MRATADCQQSIIEQLIRLNINVNDTDAEGSTTAQIASSLMPTNNYSDSPSLEVKYLKPEMFFNPSDALNFDHKNQSDIGCIQQIQFSNSILDPNIKITNPLDPREHMKVVAVLSSIKLSIKAKVINGIEFTGLAPLATFDSMEKLLLLKNGIARISWAVHSYDNAQNAYFIKFHTDEKPVGMQIISAESFISDRSDLSIVVDGYFFFKLSLIIEEEDLSSLFCC